MIIGNGKYTQAYIAYIIIILMGVSVILFAIFIKMGHYWFTTG